MNVIIGSTDDDTIPGSDLADLIRLYYGNDQANGGSGNDKIYGDAGNDTLYGGADDDQLFGDAGSDRLYGGDGNDTVSGGIGNDKLYGNSGDDDLRGSSGNDSLYGNSGNDGLFGGEGHDFLEGGEGNDTLDGGDGNDTLQQRGVLNLFDVGAQAVLETFLTGRAGNDIIEADLKADAYAELEGPDAYSLTSATVSGGIGDDQITVSLTSSGAKQWSYGAFAEAKAEIDGGSGNDLITATLTTGTIGGSRASCKTTGGSGDDTIHVTLLAEGEQTTAESIVFGGSGNDTIFTTVGAASTWSTVTNTVDAGSGNDVIVATAPSLFAADSVVRSVILGGSGNDSITVIGGTDNRLDGGTGNDTLDGSNGGSDVFVLRADAGTDVILDFELGVDHFGLADLSFEDLSLVESGSDTLITNAGTNATIALVHGIDAEALGAADFLLV